MRAAALAVFIIGILFCAAVFGADEISRVREIRYIGLSSISPRDLEGVLPLVPGDAWKEGYAKRIQKSILDYYEKRGFFHARVVVEPSSDRSVITIKATEGPPCLIKSVWVDDPPGVKSKAVRERFKSRMAKVLKVVPGERYDEVTITDRLRDLHEWLVDQNYVLVDTDTVHLSFNDAYTQVAVDFAVKYGDQVTFGFQGDTVFTRGDLDGFITQVRTTGLGKDFVGVISRKIEDEYRARAYNQIKIDPQTSEEDGHKHITFMIDEGIRTRIEKIHWEGLSPENQDSALDAFNSGASRLIQRGYYIEKDFDKAVDLVLENLRSKGYLSAKLVAKNVQPFKTPNRLLITVQVSEGDQTQVGDVQIEGVTYFPRDFILKGLDAESGKPFNPFAFEEGLQKIKASYIKEGFLYFRYETPDEKIVSFVENNRVANILIQVSEGERIRVADIRIRGLHKTREFVVEREEEIKPGDWWLGDKIDATETNLKKLGIFSEVKIIPEPSDKGAGYRTLVIDLRELEPGALEMGPGFRSDLGARAFARLSYNNIAGRNWIGVLSGQTNRRVDNDYRFIEYQVDSSFTEPRFLDTRNTYLIGLSAQKETFPPDFNAVSTTFTTGFERKMEPSLFGLKPIITARLSYRLERVRQFDVIVDGQEFPEDNRTLLMGEIIPSLTVDTRDSPFNTTKGVLATAAFEYSHPYLSDQPVYKNEENAEAPAYSKWTGAIHGYIPLLKDVVWSNVAAGGFVRSNIANRPVPLIKLFRLGGYNNMRGWTEDEINVDATSITGTLTMLNFRTQVDLPLVGDLKFAPFLDAGNLYIDSITGHGGPWLRAAVGAGIHYMTPIGPLNFDWGYKLDRLESETPGQFDFSVGFI